MYLSHLLSLFLKLFQSALHFDVIIGLFIVSGIYGGIMSLINYFVKGRVNTDE